MCPRVQPRRAAPQNFDAEIPAAQIRTVQVGDLQFAARRWLELLRQLDNVAIVKIKPGDCIVRSGPLRLLFDVDRVPLIVEHDDSVSLGVAHVVSKYGCAGCEPVDVLQTMAEILAVENVVAEYETRWVVAEEPFGNQERLSQPFGLRLHR